MNKAIDPIAEIQGVIAAAILGKDGALAGWCTNSAISPENLAFVADTCRGILSANRAEHRAAAVGTAAFGQHTLVFREGRSGLFVIYLDSPVNDAVLDWLFDQVRPILTEAGLPL